MILGLDSKPDGSWIQNVNIIVPFLLRGNNLVYKVSVNEGSKGQVSWTFSFIAGRSSFLFFYTKLLGSTKHYRDIQETLYDTKWT